jgi:epoxyqueuosine reductase
VSTALDRELQDRAVAQGFDRVGVARAQALGPEAEHLHRWLEAGRHGEMAYMQRTAAARIDPRRPGMLPSAVSVVVLATNYARRPEACGPSPGRIARYARGRDYHNVVGKRARKLARFLRARGYRARSSVDLLPVFERAWAVRSGLGFVGKNCCLIIPGIGSHVLLATILTSAPLSCGEPLQPRCGSCRLCLDACPTQAFEAANELDARRCISYLTIENPGSIPEGLRAAVDDRLFGCDECQDVCPYNRAELPGQATTAPFATDPRWGATDAASLLSLDEDAFARLTEATPLRRPGRAGLARNAAVVLGNRGGRVHLPVLRQALAQDSSEVVREAAAWAIERLEARESQKV